jgi:hypothetical protein
LAGLIERTVVNGGNVPEVLRTHFYETSGPTFAELAPAMRWEVYQHVLQALSAAPQLEDDATERLVAFVRTCLAEMRDTALAAAKEALAPDDSARFLALGTLGGGGVRGLDAEGLHNAKLRELRARNTVRVAVVHRLKRHLSAGDIGVLGRAIVPRLARSVASLLHADYLIGLAVCELAGR